MKKGILFLCMALTSVITFSQNWKEIIPTTNTPSLTNATAVLVPSRREIIVFGGIGIQGNTNALWQYDIALNQWTEWKPGGLLPEARSSHLASYDPTTDLMFIWNGQGDNGLLNDIWAYDFGGEQWLQLSENDPSGNFSLPRYGSSGAYDPESRKLVQFAGFTSSGRLADVWTYDAILGGWQNNSMQPRPGRRCLQTYAHQRNNRSLWIFGGQNDDGNLSDLWKLDLEDYRWEEMLSNSIPPARHFASMVALSDGRLWLFGGNGAGQNQYQGARNDLWEYHPTSNDWEEQAIADTFPLPRLGHIAVYEELENRMFIFGGNKDNGDLLNDLWVFQGSPTNLKKNQQLEFSLFPNPAKDFIQIELTDISFNQGNIRLFTLEGKQLKNVSLSPGKRHQLNLEYLPRGVYMLEVQLGNKTGRKKLLLH